MDVRDLASWSEWLAGADTFKAGAAQRITSTNPTTPVTVEDLIEIFQAAALDSLMAAYVGGYRNLLRWWRGHVRAAVHERIQFPADIAAMRGPRALVETPQVVVGAFLPAQTLQQGVSGRDLRREFRLQTSEVIYQGVTTTRRRVGVVGEELGLQFLELPVETFAAPFETGDFGIDTLPAEEHFSSFC